MRIGRQDQALTGIATSDADSITVRGRDLCSDLIGGIDFTSYFWLLVTGAGPSDAQRHVTNACLVAIAEHGLVPSVQAARMTLAAGPDAWQGAMAAGLLGMGSVVAGSSEVAARFLAQVAADADAAAGDMAGDAPRMACIRALQALRAQKSKVPGLGHPQHAAGDPRADRLIALARQAGVAGRHVALITTLAEEAPPIFGRALPVNVSGAIPAVMLDAGWPLDAMKGVPLLARCAGLVAHLLEESRRPIGFIMSHQADLAITYDGPPAPGGKGAL